MLADLSSYALAGIEDVPVVVVDGDRVKVVETTSGRCVLSVRQPAPDAGTLPVGSGVQVPLRKRAPERITAGATLISWLPGQKERWTLAIACPLQDDLARRRWPARTKLNLRRASIE